MKNEVKVNRLKTIIVILSLAVLCIVMATILNECAKDVDSIINKPTNTPTEESPNGSMTPNPTEFESPTPTLTPTEVPTPTPTPTAKPTPSPGAEYSVHDEYFGKKVIALTFDDGPHRIFTDRLLDGLKERGAKATFFVTSIGRSASDWDSDKRILNRMVTEGHEIGNHTIEHKNLTSISDDEIREQIGVVNERVKEMTGYDIKIFRPPGGRQNNKVLEVVKMPSIKWSVDTRDWEYLNENAIKKYAEENELTYEQAKQERIKYCLDALMGRIYDKEISAGKIKHGAILLFHDVHDATVDLALALIDELIERDYVFLTVSEAIESEGGIPVAGQSYSQIWEGYFA